MWSYDFVRDGTADGGTVRILSIIDEYTQECVLLRGARSFPARRVIDALEEAILCSGRWPAYVRSDKIVVRGGARLAQARGDRTPRHRARLFLGEWLRGELPRPAQSRVARPGTLEEVGATLEDWAHLYNFKRPHGILGKRPPSVAALRELPLRPPACAPVHAGKLTINN